MKLKQVLLVCAILVCGLVLPFSLLVRQLTPSKYDQIKVGMTEREVDVILGGPGDATFYDYLEIPNTKMWVLNESEGIAIRFDENGKVISKQFARSPEEPSLWRRIRQRFRF